MGGWKNEICRGYGPGASAGPVYRPILFLRGEAPGPEEPLPSPTATLPIDRTVTSPDPGSDASTTIKVKLSDGTVVSLSMADYLWRVVAAEMPASFEPEALKAQAVTARTYTLYKRSIGANPNHPDADVCADINCCQAYLDPDKAAANWGDSARTYTEKIAQAVSSTDGQAILYDGAPIDAVFFSSAAGRTLSSVEVWGGSVPYLESVESPEGRRSPTTAPPWRCRRRSSGPLFWPSIPRPISPERRRSGLGRRYPPPPAGWRPCPWGA